MLLTYILIWILPAVVTVITEFGWLFFHEKSRAEVTFLNLLFFSVIVCFILSMGWIVFVSVTGTRIVQFTVLGVSKLFKKKG